jgi:nicotinate-nucleotide adenylyltransferase
VGVLGGSFNPIHHAHLFTAEVAAAAHRLDTVLVLPAAQSPLKRRASASVEDRLEMVRLAVEGNPLLKVSTVDVDRPPPSYTVETMRIFTQADPEADFYLILGIDALEDLLDWRDPEGLLDLCRIVVVSRPGHELAIPEEVRKRLGPRVERILLQPMPHLEISSTEIRRRLQFREPVRYLLPESVERYIRERGLYGAQPAER